MDEQWHPRCPYISCIMEKSIKCTMHCKSRHNEEFKSSYEANRFADEVCFREFDTCVSYQEIYSEEMASTDKWDLDYHTCAFCCNSSGYTGLKINNGGTHCYCQMHGIEVENFNTNTICNWFNKKAGSNINNYFDFLLQIAIS